jgi:O-methyltransferase involved in polyketide biosynthesis
VTGSVLDDAWMDAADPSRGLLLSAQGLLMYLTRAHVHELMVRCARRFPGSELIFDGVPRWTSWVTQKAAARPATGKALMAPPMPWAMDSREAAALRALPGISSVRRLHPPSGRGLLFGAIAPMVERLPFARDLVLSIWVAHF